MCRVSILIGAVCVLLGAGSARADVLLINATAFPTWASEVKSKIAGVGTVPGNIDLFSGAGGTPTLATLDNYSAVMVFSDAGWANPTGLGNVLADYVDQGHGLVLTVFTDASVPATGRLTSGSYYPILPTGQTQNTDLHLGTVHDPSSPLMTGVNTFDGGSSSYRSTGGLASGAVDVADWSNGQPLVATLNSFAGRVVALNFYPPSSDSRADFWTSGTDGARLMANALTYAGGSNSIATPLPRSAVAGVGLLGLLGIGSAFGIRRRDGRMRAGLD
jgi:hypothetical protein